MMNLSIINFKLIKKNSILFQGYNEITVCVISLHAFGGLVVAFVMKHADNILKGKVLINFK